jgi:hypothetical protein
VFIGVHPQLLFSSAEEKERKGQKRIGSLKIV